MRDNLGHAGKIIGMAIFTSILCLFVQVSIFSMLKSFSTDVIGYQVNKVTVVEGKEVSEDLGYITKDEYPEKPEEGMKYVPVYPDPPTSVKVVETVISTILSLGILFCTTGTVFAKVAAKDRNDCDFNGAIPDKNRGFKIGLLAAIPPFVFYIVTVILRFVGSGKWVDWYYWFYRFVVMGAVKPLTDLFTSDVIQTAVIGNKTYEMTGPITSLQEVPVWAIAVQGGFILLFALFGYLMYRICYNEDSVIAKLLYKSADDHNVRRLGGR